MLPVGDLFQSYRPDIAVACADYIYVLELTERHETNMIHSHDYKKSIRTLGAMGLLWQAIGKLFPISLKFLLWVSLLIYRIGYPPIRQDSFRPDSFRHNT